MQKVTSNVWTDTTMRGCNPSMVVTRDGVVIIDTPQLPTKAVEMRREAEAHGDIRYVINTEHHVAHIFGNYHLKALGFQIELDSERDVLLVLDDENLAGRLFSHPHCSSMDRQALDC